MRPVHGPSDGSARSCLQSNQSESLAATAPIVPRSYAGSGNADIETARPRAPAAVRDRSPMDASTPRADGQTTQSFEATGVRVDMATSENTRLRPPGGAYSRPEEWTGALPK